MHKIAAMIAPVLAVSLASFSRMVGRCRETTIW